ncbi:common plant regulatory factor 1 isoform X1 [Cannabis sativa]|uniref:common plant regulatory factor 1 isoform X1 n=1 Tax=Cannabis sativa TaxID=3483 RepID=UPI0029CA386B|nr:common plant regulatory factor 1 isoform X1 [Cannabis sativa]XP_030489233.2 common plant regulatory factor 1 isoform X1 [Cannabis sativa]
MGNDEEGKSAKFEKTSPPATPDQTTPTNQANVHVYPDWAAMQAYYGPRVALPQYYNSAVASGHAPHPYLWGPPQPMMPSFGTPYAAIYPHGNVYAHPRVPLGAHGHGVPSSPALGVTPVTVSVEMPTKSSGNSEKELEKKMKGFDSLSMSIGNGNVESRAEEMLSQSTETEGSSDGSDGHTSGQANQIRRKRSREETPTTGDEKTEKRVNSVSDKTMGASLSAAGVPAKLVGPIVSPGMTTAFDLRNPTNLSPKTSPSGFNQACTVLPSDSWVQNDRELKRERRKQSNRESARRSRLRKQAETEDLARKVESLTSENETLKVELNRLTENSEKLRLENTKLVGKLEDAKLGRTEEIVMNKVDKRTQPISTENLLSRVNNSGSIDRTAETDNGMYEKNSKPGTKLHQLLDANPRADAVVAG